MAYEVIIILAIIIAKATTKTMIIIIRHTIYTEQSAKCQPISLS